MAATQPIRSKGQVRKLVGYYLKLGKLRNHVLIALGVFTALRVGDILRLRWEDVYDFDRKSVRGSISLFENKTGKYKVIALNRNVVAALALYASGAACPGHFVIGNSRTLKAISRIQAYRIVRAAADALSIGGRVSCHSLRKTFGYHVWKDGAPPMVIMDIFNHSSLEVTKRYLGITQDDRDEVYLGLSYA